MCKSKPKSLQARLFDPPFRIFVSSESDPDAEYLVDLESYDWNGQCGCPHFELRLESKLAAGKPLDNPRCKHIDAARAFLVGLYFPMIHNIKLSPNDFRPINDGQPFYLLPADGGFLVGNHLHFQEHLPTRNEFTDNTVTCEIVSRLDGTGRNGIAIGFCVLGLQRVNDRPHTQKDTPHFRDEIEPGTQLKCEVLETSPASILVLDQYGEKHTLSGHSWTPEAKPLDSAVLTMTRAGWRLAVTARQCRGHVIDDEGKRCMMCGLQAGAF